MGQMPCLFVSGSLLSPVRFPVILSPSSDTGCQRGSLSSPVRFPVIPCQDPCHPLSRTRSYPGPNIKQRLGQDWSLRCQSAAGLWPAGLAPCPARAPVTSRPSRRRKGPPRAPPTAPVPPPHPPRRCRRCRPLPPFAKPSGGRRMGHGAAGGRRWVGTVLRTTEWSACGRPFAAGEAQPLTPIRSKS
jgi:hypothetical protein